MFTRDSLGSGLSGRGTHGRVAWIAAACWVALVIWCGATVIAVQRAGNRVDSTQAWVSGSESIGRELIAYRVDLQAEGGLATGRVPELSGALRRLIQDGSVIRAVPGDEERRDAALAAWTKETTALFAALEELHRLPDELERRLACSMAATRVQGLEAVLHTLTRDVRIELGNDRAMLTRQAVSLYLIVAICLCGSAVMGLALFGYRWRNKSLGRAKGEVEGERKTLENMVQSVHDVLWRMDANLAWTWVNRASMRLYGRFPDDLIGQPYVAVASPERAALDSRLLQQAIQTRRPTTFLTTHVRKDGRRVAVRLHVTPMLDPAGIVSGIAGTVVDVSTVGMSQEDDDNRELLEPFPLPDLANHVPYDVECRAAEPVAARLPEPLVRARQEPAPQRSAPADPAPRTPAPQARPQPVRETPTASSVELPDFLSMDVASAEPARTEESDVAAWYAAEPAPPPPAPAMQAPVTDRPLRSLRIAVVDDEATVRDVLCSTLRAAGFETASWGHPVDAFEALRNPQARVDCVVTDVRMPEVDGSDLAAELRRIRPDLPILFISGHSSQNLSQRWSGVPGVDFIGKPFTSQQFLEALRDLLATARA